MGRPKNTEDQNRQSFWKRVDVKTDNECWPWKGWIQDNGYGKFCIGHKTFLLPHRYVWKITNGEIPETLLVCHHCDNRRCCNPKHLFLGTHKDNTWDAIKKGRLGFHGEKNHFSKLSDRDFSEIKRRYIPYENSGSLATEFGINPRYVWAIGHGKARSKRAQYINKCEQITAPMSTFKIAP